MQLALSIKEVQIKTGIGKTKIYEAINSGALCARKIGKKTLVLQEDLLAFLSQLEKYPARVPQNSTGE